MKPKRWTGCAAMAILLSTGPAMAIEEVAYAVEVADGACEVRDYKPHIVAETIVNGSLEDAGNQAFRRLFRYISGDNETAGKIAMTAPVTQEPRGEKISMTAPVAQRPVTNGWAVSFMMPAAYTMETLPRPKDPGVTLRVVPGRRMAAIRYSGGWSESGYRKHLLELQAWMKTRGLEAVGDPVWARYNSPFSLWFLRRNEILIPLAASAAQDATDSHD